MTHLLLLSRGLGAVPAFLATVVPDRPARIGYIPDAAHAFAGAPFVQAERDALDSLGFEVWEIPLRDHSSTSFAAALDEVDAIYVAGGDTFALLAAVRRANVADLLRERVADGLAYIGSSAGSVLAGPDIKPIGPLDDPHGEHAGSDTTGLGLTDAVVLPHADGLLPPYPLVLIQRTLARYADRFRIVPLRDDQALLHTPEGERLIESSPVQDPAPLLAADTQNSEDSENWNSPESGASHAQT
ncbi:peptidase S51 dipeptidase E [Mycetocola tolaasinivorans]|uniref:Peptidase S51 dipeptidase E n=1 Tax=Mycetocola tolaasinivorans TaxID=76635 RepID=A0A3L7A6R8_9MICO|nr:Type 1 glutamine amidotransferase-like domain-containing protein [Mycetocola tolaasinivorans]RLP75578.1 peptidase S51 dipeptidase E [Mycetocola tolaasinivorans]